MSVRFTVFGYEVWALEWGDSPATEVDPEGITGVGGQCFERDMDPPTPSNEEPWYDRGSSFGFRS